MPAKSLDRFSGAAALLLSLGAASGAAAMDQRAPSATPPAGLASQTQAAPLAESAREAAPVDLRLRAGAPATFRLPARPDAAMRATSFENAVGGAAGPAEPVLEIHFADLQADQTAIPAMRVFLGKPDATLATPLDDPHFVGAVSFFPLGAGEGGPRFTLPLGETLRKIGPIDPATADVTLIPVDLGAGAAPPFAVRLIGMGLQ